MTINGAWILAIAFLYGAWRLACWIERRRRCAVVGCTAPPDAGWRFCAEHLAQIEAAVAADHAVTDCKNGGRDA